MDKSDNRLARLIAYIHHTSELSQYWYVGNTAQCRIGLFQVSDFAGDLEGSKSTSGGLVFFRKSRVLCQQVGCARNRLQFRTGQQNQNHLFGRRIEIIPALTLWDLIEVFHSSRTQRKTKIKHEETRCVQNFRNIVKSWIRSCQLISHAQLRRKSVSDMRRIILSASMNAADFPQAFNKLLVLKGQVENPNPWILQHWRFRQRPIEERERL